MIRMWLVLTLLGVGVFARAQPHTEPAPAWLYPWAAPAAEDAAAADGAKLEHLTNSALTFSAAQLDDLFFAPDWFAPSHGPVPAIVAHGRAPDVYACGYCHSPRGQGRPENSSLAGLPVAYIEQQVADFKSGARRSARQPYLPTELMLHVAEFVSDAEVVSAAEYFSRQPLLVRVRVVEALRVPQAQVVGGVYSAILGGGDELLGLRLLEFSPDAARHQKRDETLRYIAYVPVGSVDRGRHLAADGSQPGLACSGCHGRTLLGLGPVPALAGRSPSYLLRQLLAFKTAARAGRTGASMQPVAAALTLRDMIDAVAYAASLPPSAALMGGLRRAHHHAALHDEGDVLQHADVIER